MNIRKLLLAVLALALIPATVSALQVQQAQHIQTGTVEDRTNLDVWVPFISYNTSGLDTKAHTGNSARKPEPHGALRINTLRRRSLQTKRPLPVHRTRPPSKGHHI